MAYFKPWVYRTVNDGSLRFDIMKFCCMYCKCSCQMQIKATYLLTYGG